MHSDEEIHLQGAPVSEGIAIGVPYFLSPSQDEVIPEFSVTEKEVEEEIERYRRALFSSREDLERLQSDLASEGSIDAVTIIDTHIQMLADPLMTTHMEERIRQMSQNTESVFRSVINEYEKRFSLTSDTFFQQRLIDVMDLSKRILSHLSPKQKPTPPEIPPNSVVFAKELVPSDTAAVQANRVSAFVTLSGGGNSHAALIARAKGIPYVADVDVALLEQAQGKCVIVDGQTGQVIVNPSLSTLQKYKERKKRLMSRYHLLEKEAHLKAETIDGYPVRVLANIGNLEELTLFHHYGAMGIGLFRSEYLFFQDKNFSSSEEEQYNHYRELVEQAKGSPVVIRVFDLGGDKKPEQLSSETEADHTGGRGIRFLLYHPEIFKTQLRAILRTTIHGDVRILLPLVSDVDELRLAKKLIHQAKVELIEQGYTVKDPIMVGCMVELPSAVLIGDALAKESDFLSIGTNDLVQYALGFDRSNPERGEFYFPAHPSVVRMIKMITIEAKKYMRPITVCGEIASHPIFIPLLLGLGVSEFSCSPRYIPIIKRTIRQTSLIEAYQLAEAVLQLSTASEISALLLERFRQMNAEDLSCEVL